MKPKKSVLATGQHESGSMDDAFLQLLAERELFCYRSSRPEVTAA